MRINPKRLQEAGYVVEFRVDKHDKNVVDDIITSDFDNSDQRRAAIIDLAADLRKDFPRLEHDQSVECVMRMFVRAQAYDILALCS